MKKYLKYTLITVALLLVVTTAATAALFAGYTRGVAVTGNGDVYIPTGATFSRQVDSLESSGLVKNIRRYVRYARLRKLDKSAPAGHYVLTEGMTYRELLLMMTHGRQTPVKLTFGSHIRTRERLAGVVSRYIEADSVAVLDALNDGSTPAKYGFKPETFMGMFIPNTYEFYWNTSVDGFLERMKKEYDRFWNAERTAKQEASGLSRDEVMTLASIVTEETLKADEMAKMAGVYLNRLRVGMPLQADPTIKFALQDFYLRRILHAHLQVDSPYNTYRNRGLPPGLICTPSIAAIDAVLGSETHKYLYFCAKEDFSGYHNFAETYSEHLVNARRYTNALNQRGIK